MAMRTSLVAAASGGEGSIAKDRPKHRPYVRAHAAGSEQGPIGPDHFRGPLTRRRDLARLFPLWEQDAAEAVQMRLHARRTNEIARPAF